MATDLYPHLTVEVDTEPFYADQVEQYKTALFSQRNQIRKEMRQRQEDMSLWLVEHGYQCGRDYQQSQSGYRFASEPLATMFKLVWS
jgi:hypothetical protein